MNWLVSTYRCMRMPAFLVLSVLFGSGWMASCQREVARSFRIEVTTNQGDAVHDAEVKIAGRKAGVTDAKGVLEASIPVTDGTEVAVEVNKSSDQYYFAPHMETIDPGNSNGKQVVVKAVMYFVPKPRLAEVSPGEAAAPDAQQAATSAQPETQAAPSAAPAPPEAAKEAAKEVAPASTSVVAVEPPAAVAVPPAAPVKEEPVKEKTPQNVLVTFHVFFGKQSQPGTRIMAMQPGEEEAEKLLCTTNVRGRCAVRLPSGSTWTARALRAGFVPAVQELQIDEATKLVRFNIQKGSTLEVRVVARGMMSSSPLQGVVVSVDGKPVGSTDKTGKLFHTFASGGATSANGWVKPGTASSQQVKVELAPPRGFYPPVAAYELASGGDLLISRQFASAAPKAPAVAIETARRVSAAHDPEAARSFAAWVDDAFKRKVFARGILSAAQAGQKQADIRIRRSVAKSGENLELELVATDAKGVVISAAKDVILASDKDAAAKVDAMVERLIRSLPFQGSIVAADKNQVRVAMPGKLASVLRPGDRFDVFGTQVDNRGRKVTVGNLAAAKLVSTEDAAGKDSGSQSEITLAVEYPAGDNRNPVAQGDIVIMRGASLVAEAPVRTDSAVKSEMAANDPAPDSPADLKARPEKPAARIAGSVLVRASSGEEGQGKPVPQANVYFNEVWIGATGSDGQVRIPRDLIGASGTFHVAKAGIKPASLQAKVSASSKLEIPVEMEVARLRLDSIPSGASVYLDGKLTGKTPIDTEVTGSGAFVKLEVGGVDGYKRYSSILEAEAGLLDLTAERAIQLEADMVAKAKAASESGNLAGAMDILGKIPSTHSDYLIARHMAGELALSRLDDPSRALAFFEDVTAVPQVRDFVDKRFVGSHINEGIALHMVAEKESRSNPAAAAEHFAKAAGILDRASRFVRFLPKKDFNRSVQNLEYFRALSFHRKWLISSDQLAMEKANRAWREYLRTASESGVDVANLGDAKAPAKGDEQLILAANAKVYLKQTEAGMAKR